MSPAPTPHKSPSLRVELLVTLLGLLGFVFYLSFYEDAFPSAAIQLPLSRQQIAARADEELRELGYDPSGYHSALTFGSDGSSSIYLQRMLGIPATNDLLRAETLPIYSWRMRWYRPAQQEEFGMTLTPAGEMLGFSHTIPEAEAGAALEQPAAKELALAHLANWPEWGAHPWELVSESSQDQPGGRRDHSFTWKRQDFSAGEAELRLSLTVKGDRPGYQGYWLKTPEAFWREFSTQQNRAGYITGASLFFVLTVFTLVAGVLVLLAQLRGQQPLRGALLPALVVGGVALFEALNWLPLAGSWYNTTVDYTLFWLGEVGDALMAGVGGFVMVVLLWAGGRQLNRLVWPLEDRILTRHGDRWVALARSAWRGLMLAGLMYGYTVGFYLVATRLFGGWTPMGVNYSNLYATPFPFLSALDTGIYPAVNEEFLARMIGIGLLLWLFRKRWVALIVPGALWAFAHLSYVRDPFYLRGIELFIPAVLLEGLFFLKFDLATTMMAHFVFNAGLLALPLLRSGEPGFMLSGLVVLAVFAAPLLPGLARTLLRRAGWLAPVAPEPSIRPACPEDLPALQALPLGEVDLAAATVVCLEAPAGPGGGRLVGAHLVGAHLVGAAAGGLDGRGGVEIQAMYVDPAWRGRYWGSRLADALVQQVGEANGGEVRVSVPTQDRRSLAFWASLGWRPTRQTLAYAPRVTARGVWLDLKEWVKSRRRTRRGGGGLPGGF